MEFVICQTCPFTRSSRLDGTLIAVFLAQNLDPVPTPTPIVISDGIIGGLVFVVVLIVLAMLSFGLFTGWLAVQRGRQWGLWFLLGLVSGPVALLAVGFAPDLGTHRRDEIVPPPPSPSRIDVDVDAVVYHEPTAQAYGRGRTHDGALIYFVLSPEHLRDLSDRLQKLRPVGWFVSSRDVVRPVDLPAELQS